MRLVKVGVRIRFGVLVAVLYGLHWIMEQGLFRVVWIKVLSMSDFKKAKKIKYHINN